MWLLPFFTNSLHLCVRRQRRVDSQIGLEVHVTRSITHFQVVDPGYQVGSFSPKRELQGTNRELQLPNRRRLDTAA